MFFTFSEGPLFHAMTCYKKLSAFNPVILKCFTNAALFVIVLHFLTCDLSIFFFFSVKESIDNSIYLLIKK